MLLGIALLSLAAGSSAAAAKPSKPAKQPKQLPEVVKARIKLIDLYCNTDPKESVLINTSPTEKATAAKRVPCQARPRDTLTMTAPNIVPHALTQLSSHACWSLSLALALTLALAVSLTINSPSPAAGVSEDAGGDGGGEEEGDGSQEQELHARADAHRQEGDARNGVQTGELPPCSPQARLIVWHAGCATALCAGHRLTPTLTSSSHPHPHPRPDQGAAYATDSAVKSVCANAALKVLMTTGSVGGKGRGKVRAKGRGSLTSTAGKKPVEQAARARQGAAMAKARKLAATRYPLP